MKEIRLLVVGIPGKERWSVWDDTLYAYGSPYADREGVLAYRVHRSDPDAMINDFYAYRDPMDKERMMKVFHFVLFAKPDEQMEQTLKSGALSVLEWFKLHGYQVVMIPHDGGTNQEVGRHWHILVNPFSMKGTRFSDRPEDYDTLMDFLNQNTDISWSLKFSENRKGSNPFVEVYDLNDIL